MKIIEHFFTLIAPDECLVCGAEGSLLCVACSSVKLQKLPERCYRCFKQMAGYKTCLSCRRHSVLKYVFTRTEYDQLAKNLIYALKFSFTKSAARPIAREIAGLLPPLPKNTVIVHVPAATSHARQRGFDQSALLARELSKLLNLPHIHALARIGQQRQVGASRSVREQQMKNAYRALSLSVIKDANILLVDDVTTTGSTLEAAGLTLRRAGAASVSAAVFAQAI